MSRTERAFTLLEVLVACVLLAILGTLMVEVLLPTMRASSRGAVRVELQQMAVISFDRILGDLALTPASGLSLADPDPARTAFSMHRLDRLSPQGEQVYETALVVYSWSQASGKLISRNWPPGPPAPVVPITGAAAPRLASDLLFSIGSAGGGRILATGVSEFSLRGAAGPGLVQPLHLTLALESAGQSYRLERQVLLRNTN